MELMSKRQEVSETEAADLISTLLSFEPPDHIIRWDRILNIEDSLDKKDSIIAFANDANQGHFKTYLLRACTKHDLLATEVLLSQGVVIDGDLVKLVSMQGDISILEAFLDHGWDINQPISDHIPPALCYFVHDLKLVEWFLQRGADPSQRCRLRNLTPLSFAVENAPITVIDLMLSRTTDTTTGELLHHAARRDSSDDLSVLALLVKKGVDINRIMCQNDISYNFQQCLGLGTALHEAAEQGQTRITRALLEYGADPTIRDTLGDLPAEIARRLKHVETAALLDHAQSISARARTTML